MLRDRECADGDAQGTRDVGRLPGLAAAVGAAAPENAARVLVVDEDPDVRLVQRFLSRCQTFDVVDEAVDGTQAIGLAASLQPDVILLDLAMPQMSGEPLSPGSAEFPREA